MSEFDEKKWQEITGETKPPHLGGGKEPEQRPDAVPEGTPENGGVPEPQGPEILRAVPTLSQEENPSSEDTSAREPSAQESSAQEYSTEEPSGQEPSRQEPSGQEPSGQDAFPENASPREPERELFSHTSGVPYTEPGAPYTEPGAPRTEPGASHAEPGAQAGEPAQYGATQDTGALPRDAGAPPYPQGPYPPVYPGQPAQGGYPPAYGYRPPVYGQPYQQPQYPHPGQYQQRPPYGAYPVPPYARPQPPQDAAQHTHPGVAVTRDMLPKAPPREPKPNKGLRVFAAILALVIIATGLTAGGYFLGRNAGSPAGGTSSQSKENSHGLNIDIIERGASENEENLGSQAANAAATKVSPSVVGITVYSMSDKNKGSEATGIVLTDDGYILTNDHIYADVPDAKFLIETSDKKEYEAKFVAGDSRSDLAVLKIDGVKKLTPAVIGDSDGLAVGENVIAVGNPYGRAYAGTVTKGIVSAVNRRVTGDNGGYSMKCIQTDTAINPGNSGGPLVNMEGQVVGINSSKIVAAGYEGIGFAIPSAAAVRVANSLVEHGYVADRSKLGISYQTINTVTSIQNDMPTGLYIAEIGPQSDMNGKGVTVGDIITHVGDTEIKSGEEILDAIEETKPGGVIQITVYHASTKRSSKIVVKLLADQGSSSYTTKSDAESSNSNPFIR